MTFWGLSQEGTEGQQRGWSRCTGRPRGFQARGLRTAAEGEAGAGGAGDWVCGREAETQTLGNL